MICDACGQKNDPLNNYCVTCGTFLLMGINVLKMELEEIIKRLEQAADELPSPLSSPLIAGGKSQIFKQAGLIGLAEKVGPHVAPGQHRNIYTDMRFNEVKPFQGGYLSVFTIGIEGQPTVQLPIYTKSERLTDAFRIFIANVLGHSMTSILRGEDHPLDIKE